MRIVGESDIFVAVLIPRSRWRSKSPGDKESKKKEVFKGEVLTIFPRGFVFSHRYQLPLIGLPKGVILL